MTREPCKYCGQEERYGHNAMCVMNTIEELRAEIERLTNAIRRIDSINDYPACFSPLINAVCDAILRPHLEPKP